MKRGNNWALWLVLFSVLSLIVLVPQGRAQVVSGSVSGTVVDQSGAAITVATVVLTANDTGATTRGTTSDTGYFRFVLLPIGAYHLTITKDGFQKTELADVHVNANQEFSAGEIKMSVGSQSSTVEVTAAPPLIESTQAQVTSDISGQQLATYSGVAENEGLDMMALEVPGVVQVRSDAEFANTNGTGFAVNGIRGRNNDQQIDGQNNNDNSVAGPGLFMSNVDVVEEYQITTSNFGAEYGRNSGSVVNVNTKSGTNNWHGTISGVETNSVLTTLTNVQKQLDDLKKPPRFNNEFTGGTIGGPLVKDKLFIFGGFDNQIESFTNVFSTGALVPTPTGISQLAGCFPGSSSVKALQTYGPYGVGAGNPTPVGTATTAYYDDAPVNNGIDPTTGAPACAYQLNGIQRTLPNGFHEWDWITRVDWQISSSDTVFGRYLFQKLNFFNADGSGAAGYPVSVPSLTVSVLGQWTHTFTNTVVNEFRFGYSHANVQFGGNTINTVPLQGDLGNALTSVTFSNSALLGFGPENDFPQGRIVKTYQPQDNFDFTKGRHQFKAGVNFTAQLSPNVFLPNYNGTYTFTDWGAYAANIPSSVSITQGKPDFSFKEYDTFWYFADDWKVKNNLTLNLGLTYTYYGQPANLFNQLSTAQQKSSTPFWDPALPLSATTVPTESSVKDLFGPSVGFAWTPSGRLFGNNSKTVIRGGYRLVYDPAFYNTFLLVAISAPVALAQTLVSPTAGVLADPIGTAVRSEYASDLTLGVLDPRNFNRTTVAPSFGPDRVHEWSLGIQRQITTNSVFEARYVGNHGWDLFQAINANPYIAGLAASYPSLVPSGLTPCTTPLATVPNALGRVSCSAGVTNETANTGFSNYDGLQLEYRATNLAHQLTLKMGYTFSKTLDNVSEIFSTFAGGNSIAYSQNPLNYKGQEYGLSGLDTPNVWTVAFVEDIPFMRSQQGFLGHVLGGWAVSGNYIIGSGEPYTPSQEEINYFSGGVGNDTNFDLANIGTFETSRPFLANPNISPQQVGIYAADACAVFSVGCSTAASTLISLNAINAAPSGTAPPLVPVSPKQVHFIANGGEADAIFGTPFGDVGRNSAREFWTNTGNFTLFKNIKFWERATLQFHTTMTNVFNHPNYVGINPFIENAGLPGFFNTFANPYVQSGGNRTIYFGLKIIF
ncbi:MAG: carboxypeptidase-like regulatory domain-containing protein [Candidatus Acidiferrum sp.]